MAWEREEVVFMDVSLLAREESPFWRIQNASCKKSAGKSMTENRMMNWISKDFCSGKQGIQTPRRSKELNRWKFKRLLHRHTSIERPE
jgi:hypothetical protein